MPEYRIGFSIQRSDGGDENFTEIGFGSSGTWGVADGWTTRDLHQLALFTANRYRSRATAHAERYAAAWSAAAEAVCTAGEPPARDDVASAARDGINSLIYAHRRFHGLSQASGYTARHASFTAYWHQLPSSGWEDAITDRIALRQVWEAISPANRRVLAALAEHGDQESAASALGMVYATYRARLREARIAFRVLWHEGEAPSRQWGCDRRSYRRGEPLKGTAVTATRLIAARRRQREARSAA